MGAPDLSIASIRALHDDEYGCVVDFMALLEPDIAPDVIHARMQTMRQDGWRCIGAFGKAASPIGIAGYSFRTHLFSGKVMYVENVALLPDARNQGIGDALMSYLRELAINESAKKITLDAYQRNEGARRFYQRLGYDPRGVHFVLDLD
jgi:GNAT superfamily N-acetyltransferase